MKANGERPAARELEAASLRRVQPPDSLGFDSTDAVEPLAGTLGQARAGEAVAFALDAEMPGYNIFAAGPAGVGKRTSIEAQLRERAGQRTSPPDWVYLNSFEDPRRPLVVALPHGRARDLAGDVRRFLEDARRDLAAAFDSDTYAERRREITKSIDRQQERAMAELSTRAHSDGIAVELTPAGIVSVPLRDNQPLTAGEFAQLPEEVRARYQAKREELGPQIEAFLNNLRVLQRTAREELRALDREVAAFAIGHLIDELKERFAETAKLVRWLDALQEDVTQNLGQFQALAQDTDGGPYARSIHSFSDGPGFLDRYEVNVFVAADDGGAPVLTESNPTYANLFGRIEHQGVLGGGFVTDHRMIRSGAVHRANGGYLILPAAEVLTQPFAWLKLKEVLRTRQIRIENPAEQYALFPTATLNPEPIDLDLKVVLVGSPQIYELAYAYDEDFPKLFRVKADFDWRVAWDERGTQGYAGFLSSQVRENGLHHFDSGAVARVIEHGGRLVESRDWLSTRFVDLAGVAAEASHWAEKNGSKLVQARHVERAIEQRLHRSDLIEQRVLQMVAEGTLLLDLTGERVGEVNGLAVIELGDHAFGHPVRVTASAGPGRGSLVSIERETKLSGHVHDKGFLTLSGYLRERYGAESRIALAANLAFEQSYDYIEGDSAASAELYALLSKLAEVPVRQDIAVTGSVNQHGELQAIGGVNEKIEGFHRTCSLGGLSGTQGVLIPESNVRHLMLAPEVVASVREGRFHVWSARTVEEGIELLTGVAAGEREADGGYPAGTIHGRIEERLARWALLGEEQEALRSGAGEY